MQTDGVSEGRVSQMFTEDTTNGFRHKQMSALIYLSVEEKLRLNKCPFC